MEDLSLHILDIVENSITAGANKIWIRIIEDTKKNLFQIEIADNGKGMDMQTRTMAADPFFSTKTRRRVGLGISFLAQAAQESSGNITLTSKKGKGTIIKAKFQYNHIDRKPLGDIEKTLSVLIASNPEIDYFYEHKRNRMSFHLSTREIRKTLREVPVNHPEVIKFIKDSINKWLNETKNITV